MNNGEICVSVCAETANEFIEKIERAAKLADIIELRFDCLKEQEFALALPKIAELSCKTPYLATFRPKSSDAQLILARRTFEGGYEAHKERVENAINYRFSGWKKILKLGNVNFVDFELDIFFCFLVPNGDSTEPVFSLEADEKLKELKIIVSEHNFNNTPNNLDQMYEGMLTKDDDLIQSDIIKIAVQANDATDGLELLKLLKRAKTENKDLIPIAMGEHGIWTRILGLSRGAFMTFAALDDESATAPGQLTAQEMIDVYHVKELDENTEIYGLVGGSVTYSVSPQMHNAAFKFNGLNAVYVPFAVKNLEEFMRRMVNPATREIEWNLRGFGVTIPHKIEIMQYLDFVDETAQKIGAVNTVKIEGDKLYGYNTDAQGFIEPLLNSYGGLQDANVALFGAGGAARACVYALKNTGANVTVYARNLEKAKSFEEDFQVKVAELASYDLRTINYDIVVNTTPLGMKKGEFENETITTAEQLEGVGLVYDLVYNPFETRLMQEANKVFVPTVGGLAMLVAQAMQQQKIWTGLDAPMKEMSAAALRKLQL